MPLAVSIVKYVNTSFNAKFTAELNVMVSNGVVGIAVNKVVLCVVRKFLYIFVNVISYSITNCTF